jgi:hypothetical protein
MSATDFEVRHQTLLHLLLVSLAFRTFSVRSRNPAHRRCCCNLHLGSRLSRAANEQLFSSCRLRGPYRQLRYPSHLGDLLFALGLGSLAPLPGFLLLVAGQAFLVRLIRRAERDLHRTADSQQILPRVPRLLPSFRPCLPPQRRRPQLEASPSAGIRQMGTLPHHDHLHGFAGRPRRRNSHRRQCSALALLNLPSFIRAQSHS